MIQIAPKRSPAIADQSDMRPPAFVRLPASIRAEGTKYAEVARGAANAAIGNVSGYIGNKIAGNDVSFSWRSIAASVVSSVIAHGVSKAMGFTPKTTEVIGASEGFKNDLANGLIGGVVSLHTRRAFGSGDTVDYGAIAADAFGNALGNSAVSKINEVLARRAALAAENFGRKDAEIASQEYFRKDALASIEGASASDGYEAVRAIYGEDFASAVAKLGGLPLILDAQNITGILYAKDQHRGYGSSGSMAGSISRLFELDASNPTYRLTSGETEALAEYITKLAGVGTTGYANVPQGALVMLVPAGARAEDVYGLIGSQFGRFAQHAPLLKEYTDGIFAEEAVTNRSHAFNLSGLAQEVEARYMTAIYLHPRSVAAWERYERTPDWGIPLMSIGGTPAMSAKEGALLRFKSTLDSVDSDLRAFGYMPARTELKEAIGNGMLELLAGATSVIPVGEGIALAKRAFSRKTISEAAARISTRVRNIFKGRPETPASRSFAGMADMEAGGFPSPVRRIRPTGDVDAAAEAMAKRYDGQASVEIEGFTREFDMVSAEYVGQTTGPAFPGRVPAFRVKPNNYLNKARKEQIRATLEAAQVLQRKALFEFRGGSPHQSIVDFIDRNAARRSVGYTIDVRDMP